MNTNTVPEKVLGRLEGKIAEFTIPAASFVENMLDEFKKQQGHSE